MRKLTLQTDNRIFGSPKWYLGDETPLMFVPPEIRRCVAFAGYRKMGQTKVGGTIFFINRPVAGRKYEASYAVTAKHVVDGCRDRDDNGNLWIRVNTKDGKFKEIQTDCADWISHPTDQNVDVAVIPLPKMPIALDQDAFPMTWLVTEEVMRVAQAGPGDELFIIGLFKMHSGSERNLPIIRVGNIAAMPEEPIRIKSGHIEAFLIEARSIGGLSGSPVFALLDNPFPPNHPMRAEKRTPDGRWIRPMGAFYLLGLMHGHFDVDESDIDVEAKVEDSTGSGKINVGIGIVVPTRKILEVLDHPELLAEANRRADEDDARNAATPD